MSVNVYQMVTDRIIEELQKGVVPWKKPWGGVIRGAVSYETGNPYSLLNQILLGVSGEYLTFIQCKKFGGKIKKGAKSKFVVFYSMVENKNIETVHDDGSVTYAKYPMLRYYNVFHIDDCEGIESKIKSVESKSFNPNEEAENIINGYLERDKKLKLRIIQSNSAYYSPTFDEVILPLKEQFVSESEFYSTAFHELTHSTMPAYRCDRKQEDKVAAFGTEEYSREELVAEIGSAMLCNHCGIDIESTFKNSVAYIQSWIKKLKNDNRMIVWAASRAEKSTNYILNNQAE